MLKFGAKSAFTSLVGWSRTASLRSGELGGGHSVVDDVDSKGVLTQALRENPRGRRLVLDQQHVHHGWRVQELCAAARS